MPVGTAAGRSTQRRAPLPTTVADGTPAPILLATDRTPARRRDAVARRALAAADVTALGTAGAMAVVVASPVAQPSALALLLVLPLWVLFHKVLGLYDRDANVIHRSTLNELPRLAQSLLLGTGCLFLFLPSIPALAIPRSTAIAFLGVAMILVPAARSAARAAAGRHTGPERVLIVGSGQVADLVGRKLTMNSHYGVAPIGFVDAGDHRGHVAGLPRLGAFDDFNDVCALNDVDRVVVAFSALSHDRLLDVIRTSKRLGIKLSIVPRLFEVIGQDVEVDQLEGLTLLGLRGMTRTRSTLLLKRGIDVVGAATLLLAMAPVMLVAAAAIRFSSPGPVLFVQRRVGRGNREFPMLKFRTMVDGADALKRDLLHLNEADGVMFKMAADPRVTPVGRLLRRTSIDELPQLFNVLRGDMSLVGPRPLVPSEDAHVLGWHRARLDLTPGLTGPWQVLGRTAIPFDEMVTLDWLYVTEWSLWNDLKLLLRTIPVVVGRRGQ